jgi:hypothetical protein
MYRPEQPLGKSWIVIRVGDKGAASRVDYMISVSARADDTIIEIDFICKTVGTVDNDVDHTNLRFGIGS